MGYDVAIIGGGPAGSTCGSLLRRYAPDLSVLIIERERFPRDHIGESQLPAIGLILEEMGCWDKVEAAKFPIKIGATYRWGQTDDLWDFNFVPPEAFGEETRPASYEGIRRLTAFQVDRAVYDNILLDHAAELGCEVRQSTQVTRIDRDGDRITGLVLSDGTRISARYYVDASGVSAVIRSAMGVEVDSPTHLRNIAIWDYYQNAEWAVEIGVGGTRIQVMSLGWGWIWFIPLGPSRTSVGLVCPAEHYKTTGLKPRELFEKALREEPRIAGLLKNARSEGKLSSTKDWSILADRTVGQNWFLTGETCGFADPILSAGMTLAHTSARDAAYTILELDRGEIDAEWLRERYDEAQRARIASHIKFADFWYAGNGIFTDLQDYTSKIAAEAGLTMTAEEAFRWLSTGGFAHDNYVLAQIGTWDVTAMKILSEKFTKTKADWRIATNNVFKLNLEGAEKKFVPLSSNGRIERVRCFVRNGKVLPNAGEFRPLIHALRLHSSVAEVLDAVKRYYQDRGMNVAKSMPYAIQTFEAMVTEGWVEASADERLPFISVETPDETTHIHRNRDAEPVA